MADSVVSSASFRVVAVYVPNGQGVECPHFPSVGAVPGRFVALSLHGGLECHSRPQHRQGAGS